MFKIFSFIIVVLFSANANAASTEWANSDNIKARITYENNELAVEIVPDSGWHFYAAEAGDAGVPTEFKWEGINVFKMKYPPHKTFEEYGLVTYGYDSATKFIAEGDFAGAKQVKLRLTGAVCHEVCIPFDISLAHQFRHAELDSASPQSNSEIAGQARNDISLQVIWTAFLAGLILNIMPCVLPVLSLKVLSLVKQSGKAFAQARVNFLSTAAGIVTSFLLLAIAAIILKNSGETLGWGLHFQSPIFVSILLLLTLLFSLSLFGVFHLRVPSWISDQGAHADSVAGNFVAGMLATLLGTACTAPVLVSAVGFALAGSSAQILIIFAIMGVGMALPYLLFAAFPRLAKFLPKPGKWMVWVKNIMAVLLFLTAAWLGSILYAQIGTQENSKQYEWVAFDEKKIAEFIAQERPVFVDITAKWCVNCQVNKLNVIETDEMEKFMLQNRVVRMRGDMTRPSQELLDYIRKFGRTGIPFNAVYGKGLEQPIILSPILSTADTKAAILQAKSK